MLQRHYCSLVKIVIFAFVQILNFDGSVGLSDLPCWKLRGPARILCLLYFERDPTTTTTVGHAVPTTTTTTQLPTTTYAPLITRTTSTQIPVFVPESAGAGNQFKEENMYQPSYVPESGSQTDFNSAYLSPSSYYYSNYPQLYHGARWRQRYDIPFADQARRFKRGTQNLRVKTPSSGYMINYKNVKPVTSTTKTEQNTDDHMQLPEFLNLQGMPVSLDELQKSRTDKTYSSDVKLVANMLKEHSTADMRLCYSCTGYSLQPGTPNVNCSKDIPSASLKTLNSMGLHYTMCRSKCFVNVLRLETHVTTFRGCWEESDNAQDPYHKMGDYKCYKRNVMGALWWSCICDSNLCNSKMPQV